MITHDQAFDAVHRIINGRGHMSVPAREVDDDLLLFAYIEQRRNLDAANKHGAISGTPSGLCEATKTSNAEPPPAVIAQGGGESTPPSQQADDNKYACKGHAPVFHYGCRECALKKRALAQENL